MRAIAAVAWSVCVCAGHTGKPRETDEPIAGWIRAWFSRGRQNLALHRGPDPLRERTLCEGGYVPATQCQRKSKLTERFAGA